MSKTILIVEDYADVRMMMKILVRRYGYDVIDAADGYEAVEKAKKHRPDMILMDLSMPIMDGLTAAQIIKQMDGFADTPIIALTAYGQNYDRGEVEKCCNEIISKPLKFRNLKPLIQHYLS